MNEQETLKPKRPTHRAYIAREKGRWLEIGAAWLHKDGKGFRVKLEAVPIDGQPIECRIIDWKAIDAGKDEPTPDEGISKSFGEY